MLVHRESLNELLSVSASCGPKMSMTCIFQIGFRVMTASMPLSLERHSLVAGALFQETLVCVILCWNSDCGPVSEEVLSQVTKRPLLKEAVTRPGEEGGAAGWRR